MDQEILHCGHPVFIGFDPSSNRTGCYWMTFMRLGIESKPANIFDAQAMLVAADLGCEGVRNDLAAVVANQ